MIAMPLQILVHGEQNEMARLKAALIREYEDNDQVHIEVHNPRNTEAVTLNFRGEKLAKVTALPEPLVASHGLCDTMALPYDNDNDINNTNHFTFEFVVVCLLMVMMMIWY